MCCDIVLFFIAIGVPMTLLAWVVVRLGTPRAAEPLRMRPKLSGVGRRCRALREFLGRLCADASWLLGGALLALFVWLVLWFGDQFIGRTFLMRPPWEVILEWMDSMMGYLACAVPAGRLASAPPCLPLAVAVVALPTGMGILLLTVLFGAGVIYLAVRQQAGADEAEDPRADDLDALEAEMRGIARRMSLESAAVTQNRPPTYEEEIISRRLSLVAAAAAEDRRDGKDRRDNSNSNSDPLSETLPAGLDAAELGRILGACHAQACAVRGHVARAKSGLGVEDYEAALLSAHDDQCLLIGCLHELVRRLGDARPDMLKHEQRTAEEGAATTA